jgi:hypothetical protein
MERTLGEEVTFSEGDFAAAFESAAEILASTEEGDKLSRNGEVDTPDVETCHLPRSGEELECLGARMRVLEMQGVQSLVGLKDTRRSDHQDRQFRCVRFGDMCKKAYRLERTEKGLPWFYSPKGIDHTLHNLVEIFNTHGYTADQVGRIRRLGGNPLLMRFIKLWVDGHWLISSSHLLRLIQHKDSNFALQSAFRMIISAQPDNGTRLRRHYFKMIACSGYECDPLLKSISRDYFLPGEESCTQEGFGDYLLTKMVNWISPGRLMAEAWKTVPSKTIKDLAKSTLQVFVESIYENVRDTVMKFCKDHATNIIVALEVLCFVLLCGVIVFLTKNNPALRWGLLAAATLVGLGVTCGTKFANAWVPIVQSKFSSWFSPKVEKEMTDFSALQVVPAASSFEVKLAETATEVKSKLEKAQGSFVASMGDAKKDINAWFASKFPYAAPALSELGEVLVEEEEANQEGPDDSKGVCGVVFYYIKSRMFAEDPATLFSQDCSKFNTITLAMKNFAGFVGSCVSALGKLIDWCWESATGRPFFDSSQLMYDLEKTVTVQTEILKRGSMPEAMTNDPELRREVINAYGILTSYRNRMLKAKSFTPQTLQAFGQLIFQFHPTYISAFQAENCAGRQEPVWVYLYGAPGTGKTTLLTFILAAVHQKVKARKMTLADRYERKQSQEFWDGYAGQWATTIDDIYQGKSADSRELVSTELIYACNNNAYPLHMAHLEEKSTTLFKSTMIGTTTNEDIIPPDLGIKSPEALMRRRDFVVKVSAAQEYVVPGIKGPVVNYPPTEKWCFEDFDRWVLELVGQRGKLQRISFADLVERIYKLYLQKMRSFEGLEKSLASIDFSMLNPASPVVPTGRSEEETRIAQQRSWDIAQTHLASTTTTSVTAPAKRDDAAGVGLNPDGTEDEADQEGFFDYFKKGYDPNEVTKILARFDPGSSGFVYHRCARMEDYNLLVGFYQSDQFPSFPNRASFATTLWIVAGHLKFLGYGSYWYCGTSDSSEYQSAFNTVTGHYQTLDNVLLDRQLSVVSFGIPKDPLIVRGIHWYKATPRVRVCAVRLQSRDIRQAHTVAECIADFIHNSVPEQTLDPGFASLDQTHVNAHRFFMTLTARQRLFFRTHVFKTTWNWWMSDDESWFWKSWRLFKEIVEAVLLGLMIGTIAVLITTAIAAFITAVLPVRKKHFEQQSSAKYLAYKDAQMKKNNPWKKDKGGKAFKAPKSRHKPSRQARRDFKDNARVIMQSADENASSLVQRIEPNVVPVTMQFEDGVAREAFVFFITSHVAVTASHSISHSRPLAEIVFHTDNNRSEEGSSTFLKTEFEVRNDFNRDLSFITFPNSRCFRDLTSHLRQDEQDLNVRGITRVTYDGNRVWLQTGTHIEPVVSLKSNNKATGTSMVLKGVLRAKNCEGGMGECSLPYVFFNSTQNFKLVGIHVGGQGEDSIVAPLYTSDFVDEGAIMECALSKMSLGDPITPEGCPLIYSTMRSAFPGVRMLGRLPRPIHLPGDTKIVPSFVQTGVTLRSSIETVKLECPYPINEQPVRLRPFQDADGKLVSPLMNSMSNFAQRRGCPLIPEFLEEDIFAGILPKDFHDRIQRPLSIDEAVHGVPSLENFPSLPTNTSAGFGFTELGYTSGPTEANAKYLYKHATPTEPAWISEELRFQVEARIKAADQGIITPAIVKGCLKDEKRSKARAQAGQARIFWVSEKAHVVWCRMFLGTFVSAIEHTQEATDISVGINPHDISWRMLWYHLNKFGEDGKPSCDDVKNWDMNYYTRAVHLIARWIIRSLHLKYDSFWAKQIYACVISTFQPLCIIADILFTWDFMPSGCWLTSILNSVLNSIAHRAMWRRLAPADLRNSYDKYVVSRVFGDDKLLANHRLVLSWWNGLTISKLAFQLFNWVTTSPDKLSDLKPYTEWDQAVFLKRRFRQQDALVFPPLQEETLIGQVLWSSINKEHSVDEQTMLNCHIALNEWFYHGQQKFDFHKKLLNRYLFIKNPQWIFQPTYGDLMSKFTQGHVRS